MKKYLLIIICLAFIESGCKKHDSEPKPIEEEVVEEPIVETSRTYEEFGLSTEKTNIFLKLLNSGTFPEIHSLLIVKNDSLIVEQYFGGYNREDLHPMMSVSKSFTSALIGIALDKDILKSVDSKIVSFFPNYTATGWKSEITIDDILTMRTGVDYNESTPNSPHDQLNQLNTGWDLFYLNRPMIAKPGSVFNYDSGGVILLSSILKSAGGSHADVFANLYLFPKLGITEKWWYKNKEGHTHAGGGLSLKPVDMIKLGILYLNKGVWNGQQVVSESWVDKSFEMHVNLESAGDPFIKGYGYLWWILKPSNKTITNQYVYAAIGVLGQYIFVIPEYNMVVAVTGGTSNHSNFQNPQQFLYDYILDAVQ